MMIRDGARGSPGRTPALILKFVVSPSGVGMTAEVVHRDGRGIGHNPGSTGRMRRRK